MHLKSNFTPYNDANEVVDELFESLRSRYQGNLRTSKEWREFIFDSVQLMYYICHIVNFRRVGSYNEEIKCNQETASGIKPFIIKYT